MMCIGENDMKTKDRVINVEEYVKYILRRWYVLLVFIIAFGILTSAVYVIQHNGKTDIPKTGVDEAYSQLSDIEKAHVTIVQNNFVDYCECVSILNNSIIERINPNDAKKYSFTYVISYSGNSIDSNTMNSAVNTAGSQLYYYCVQGGLVHDVSDDLDIETRILEECIVASTYVNDSGCFNIVMFGSDIIPELPDSIKANLAEYASDLFDVDVELAAESISSTRSSYVFSAQKSLEEGLATIQKRFEESTKNLSDKEIVYLELVLRESNPDIYAQLFGQTVASKATAFSYKGLLKYMILGGAIGTALCLLMFLARFVFSHKIISTHDYTDMLKIRLIDSIQTDMSNLDFTVSRIRKICDKNEIHSISIISSENELYKEIINEIINKLSQTQIEVAIFNDFMNNYDSYELFQRFGNCILVEKVGVSKLNKVIDEADFCIASGVNIIGVVNIEE